MSMTEDVQDNKIAIDPRLLDRALKRMQGLVNDNGFDPDQVVFGPEMGVFQYKFGAKVQIKLVPKYGIRTEPGKNTVAELAVSVEDFQRKIQSAIIDAREKPEKRQKIIDFIFSRSDKGFGIESQNVVFRDLAMDLVRHEQCQTCSHSGHIPCAKCQGRGVVTCARCRGTRQTRCPKCGGSSHIQTPKGSTPCDYCRASGKVACPLCHAKGQMKCTACGASGVQPCEKCSGTGWMSHLAHIEIQGQVRFSFEQNKIPEHLAALVEDRGGFLVSKGDIEVHLVAQTTPKEPVHMDKNLSETKVLDSTHEPDDLVVIEYDVMCPYGPVQFQLGERVVPAIMLGWQARLIEAPAFLEDLTKIGMQAIQEASSGRGPVVALLRKAAGFAVWREVLTQIVSSGNLKKAIAIILNRYPAGIDEGRLRQTVMMADRAVRSVTRTARYIGLALAMALFGAVSHWYFRGGLRAEVLKDFSQIVEIVSDVLMVGCGALSGIIFSQISASIAQRRAFSGIVPDEALKKLPRVGHVVWWSLGFSILVFGSIVGLEIIQGGESLPRWIIRLMQG